MIIFFFKSNTAYVLKTPWNYWIYFNIIKAMESQWRWCLQKFDSLKKGLQPFICLLLLQSELKYAKLWAQYIARLDIYSFQHVVESL